MSNFVISSTSPSGASLSNSTHIASIVSLRNKRRKYDGQIEEIEHELASLREDQQKLQIQLSNFSEADLVDEHEVDHQKEELRKAQERFDELDQKCDE